LTGLHQFHELNLFFLFEVSTMGESRKRQPAALLQRFPETAFLFRRNLVPHASLS
jgi:hypothetical protein